MSECVAGEHNGLEKQDAGGPYGSAAAKPGENVLGDDEFELEQQECGEKNAQAKQECPGRRRRTRNKFIDFEDRSFLNFHETQIGNAICLLLKNNTDQLPSHDDFFYWTLTGSYWTIANN